MPTPRAITGKVATFTPMPMATIKASQRIEVSTSGNKATTVARQLRKVIRQNSVTARYTYSSMVWLASRTTILVAASMPAVPAASRNWRSGVLFSLANLSAIATTASRVSALWSLR
ncbi:hypothetical protein D3C80_1584170 [compost metagenome]